ncbi:MAG: ATP-dependent helicase HrpB [Bacteroidales bacterium]|nr:ATP-dependent helicase HrpB [Bacteroidales bacterium]
MNISDEAQSLPAYNIAQSVNTTLRSENRLIITAPPGAGKSTLLPLTILQGLSESPKEADNESHNDRPDPNGKIIMLEPRRLAARQIAERMAHLIGEDVGGTVGYAVRFDRCLSSATRIEVVTEGILTRRLVTDPTLEGVSVIIFDEFHERSINADVALALAREVQQVLRPDLRIVIMSATIETTALCRDLSAKLIESQGRMFPVDIRLTPDTDSQAEPATCADLVARRIVEAHTQHEGDILAFLPGETDIRRCQSQLANKLGSTHIMPLYGMLSQREQRMAISPSRPGERKVVLATPIAETSVTIEGVRIVIDSGLCRQMIFDPQNGMSHLETVRISMDMADQRAGRAGRVAPGICYRLWTVATQHRMQPNRRAEIETADLAPMVLDIAAWGERDPMRLAWLTPPPKGHVAQAQSLLTMLGALSDSDNPKEQGSITPHGRELSHLPCHPRMAQMMLMAHNAQQQTLAADIAAILEEKDPLAQQNQRGQQGQQGQHGGFAGQNESAVGCDIALRIDALRKHRAQAQKERSPMGGHGGQWRAWDRIAKIAEQYRRLTADTDQQTKRGGTLEDNSSFDKADIGYLLAAAYPERIASAREGKPGLYMLSSGDMAQMGRHDDLSAEPWIVAAEVNTQSGPNGIGKIFMASALDPRDLRSMVRERDVVTWDIRRGGIVAQRELRIGSLILGSRPLQNVPADEVRNAICDAVVREGERIMDFGADEVLNIQQRIGAVSLWHPEMELPDVSTEALKASAHEWLPLFMGKAQTVAELKKIDMAQVVASRLTYEQQMAVDRLAPERIEVPTGSKIRVEYRPEATAPVLRVRLQECFGMRETPRVDNGQRPVLMELLSPGYKPVQLTQDLHSFWENTYFEVRKELKRRYPKHSWPDNPLEADAVRGVARKKQ